MDKRRKNTKIMYIVFGSIIILSIIVQTVFSFNYVSSPIFFIIRAMFSMLSMLAFVGLFITIVSNLKLSKSVSYNKEQGTTAFMSEIGTSKPVFSATSIRYFGFNFYDNGVGFFIDRPGITLRYDDIKEIKVVRHMAHRNVFDLAINSGKPLVAVNNGAVEIGDRSMLLFKTKSDAKFVTHPMVPVDAQKVINYVLKRNPEIEITDK